MDLSYDCNHEVKTWKDRSKEFDFWVEAEGIYPKL